MMVGGNMHRIGGILAVLLLSLPLGLTAQTATPEREQEIQEMRARIATLERVVEELRLERDSKTAVTAQPTAVQMQNVSMSMPTATSSSRASSADEHSSPTDEHASPQLGTSSGIEQTYPALHFRGFGNMNFSATDDPTTKSGFNLGQFILHVASP